jgi:hypothetical protein
MRFSARLTASKGNKGQILEDAPRPTRVGYIKSILGEFIGITGYGGVRNEPLDTHDTHCAFIALIRDESETWDYDRENSWMAITSHLKECNWPEFYDFVELLGKLLLKKEDEDIFCAADYFKTYQSKVNLLLQEDGIGWNLNDSSDLYRHIPEALSKRVALTESALTDNFSTARIHYHKAIAYLYQHPIDEANSIKEIVSAIESVSRTLAPKTKTLGEAIKQMRKDPKYSTHLLDALERLYVYSNATPLVRHGHIQESRPLLAEAELSLHIGVAYIRYLIDVSDGGN